MFWNVSSGLSGSAHNFEFNRSAFYLLLFLLQIFFIKLANLVTPNINVYTANPRYNAPFNRTPTLISPRYNAHLVEFRDNFNLSCLDEIA